MDVIVTAQDTGDSTTVEIGEDELVAILKCKASTALYGESLRPAIRRFDIRLRGAQSMLNDDTAMRDVGLSQGDHLELLRLAAREYPEIPTPASYHTGKLQLCCAISPCGKTLFSGSIDGRLTQWNTIDGSMTANMLEEPTQRDTVTAVAVSKDGEWVYAVNPNSAGVRVLSTTSEERFPDLRGHTGPVLHLAVSPGGSKLYTASQREVRVWNTSTGRHEASWSLESGENCTTLQVSPCGGEVYTGTSAGAVHIWGVYAPPIGAKVHTYSKHTSAVTCMTACPNDKGLFTGGNDGQICLWDAMKRKYEASFEGHIQGVTGLSVDADAVRLFSCSQDGAVKVWCVPDRYCMATVQGFAGARSIVLSPCARYFYLCCADGIVARSTALPNSVTQCQTTFQTQTVTSLSQDSDPRCVIS